MCGITGIWNHVDEKLALNMTLSVAHRGPDGIDSIVEGNASLGASRLAILGDPSASAIYHDATNQLAVMLNGEIYNVSQLRQELIAAGFSFKTDLETEVIARLYTLRGPGFAAHLKGMFAIVIVDHGRLILARDRMGIKPLYYAVDGSKVIFGSEIKAILRHLGITPSLDLSALEEITVFGYIQSPPKTLFKGIVQVEPGTVLALSPGGQSTVRYFLPPAASYCCKDAPLDYSSAVKEVRRLVIDAVKVLLNHGRHDIGIYLSGGLDSTILTLVARQILGFPVTTFTMADSTESADFKAAREVATRMGTRHLEYPVTVDDYFQKLDHFVYHYESLIAGGVFDIHGGMAFHMLSEKVSQHVKVAFSGEGADELFGGYYWAYTHPLGFADRLKARMQAIQNPNGTSGLIDNLFPEPEDENAYRLNIFDALLGGGLSNYHLQSVDRSAGAYGFEIRPAYLYDDLAAFAMDLPVEYKVEGKMITKRILRDAFRPDIEQAGLGFVLTRLKDGMPAAVSNIAPRITERMESLVPDSELINHPLKNYLRSKTDIYLFNKFAGIFGVDLALQDCPSQ